MARPLTQSDLLFPTASHQLSLSTTLSSLKRSALSIHNRLSSITTDSNFIQSVSEAYALPLIANERCGSWYIPPSKKAESVYFKSTDGHTGEWSFSLRRLNLQLLDVVEKYKGCVIVDSTRRGKSMPDALSKTVPIWCCVLNRAIFSEEGGMQELYTAPQAVSQSEHAQIEKRIERFVRQFLDICNPNIKELRMKIRKPLRPIWVTQGSSLPDSPPTFPDFHPIVLCTASRRVHGAEGSEGGYIQGAADDHEAWAHGLTPKIFWANHKHLLSTNEEQLPDLIAQLTKEEKGPKAVPTLIKPTSNLFISSSQNLDVSPFDVLISCTPSPLTTTRKEDFKKSYLHLKCQVGKLGSRDLRTQLPQLRTFFSTLPFPPGKILICCPTAKDLSVGVALAILCLYADDSGTISTQPTEKKIDKTFIKQRLTWITTSNPAFNPPRTTLQSINALLMPSPSDPKLASSPTNLPFSTLTLVDANGEGLPLEPNNEDSKAVEMLSTPASIFAGLCNAGKPWHFTRTLTSQLPTHFSGTVTGTATFTSCSITTPNTPEIPTLLYSEEGEFATTNGLRFTARRKYVYQLKPSPDTDSSSIVVHFFDDEKMRDKGKESATGVGPQGEGIGGLFVEMDELKAGVNSALEARNKAQHLCAEDLYTASWKFGGGMLNLESDAGKGGNGEDMWWEVRYDVKGPKKDYVSETRYTK